MPGAWVPLLCLHARQKVVLLALKVEVFYPIPLGPLPWEHLHCLLGKDSLALRRIPLSCVDSLDQQDSGLGERATMPPPHAAGMCCHGYQMQGSKRS